MRSFSGWLGSLSRSSTSSTPGMTGSNANSERTITKLGDVPIVEILKFERLLHFGIEDALIISEAFLNGVMPAPGLVTRRPLLFSAVERKSDQRAIVKVIYKASFSHSRDRVQLEHLCEKLLELPYHPLLLTIYGIYEDAERWYIISEVLKGPELFHFLLQEESLPEELCKHIIRQILLGLELLHSNNLVHRDVKPENLVFRTKAETVSWPRARHKALARKKVDEYMTQFELVLIDLDTAHATNEDSAIQMEDGQARRRIVGTYNYMAPEVLYGVENSPTSDLWGVGVILYILMTGALPIPMMQMTSIRSSIATHMRVHRAGGINFNAYPLNAFPGAQSLCEQLLQAEPQKRLKTATEALEHPWLASSATLSEAYYLASNVRTPNSLCFRKGGNSSRMMPPPLARLSSFSMPAPLWQSPSPTTPMRKNRRFKEISALSTAAQEEGECL